MFSTSSTGPEYQSPPKLTPNPVALLKSLECPATPNPPPASVPAFILDQSLAEAEGPLCRVFRQLGFVWVKAHTEQGVLGAV